MSANKPIERHPAGPVKYGPVVGIIRVILLSSWISLVLFVTMITQFAGVPLYWISKDYYYAYMALTKKTFGLLIVSITQWFSPTVVRVSGDKSMRGQLSKTKDGRLQCDFSERLVLVANHQIYTDWLYLWWIAYTNELHGHIYIILKESLKYIPILGPGMIFYGFIFMARNWVKDKPRLQHRLEKLKGRHGGPLSGSQSLDPMWLILFPEGTNLSPNTRPKSAQWAAKQGIRDLRHALLPRSTGLQYCLQQLEGTIDYVYDCTIAYEGIPNSSYAQDYFTLPSTCFQGLPPKSVNMYWRRFRMASIPIHDTPKFEAWLNKVWREKDGLLELYRYNGRFPADEAEYLMGNRENMKVAKGVGYIETSVRLAHLYELASIFTVMIILALLTNGGARLWNLYKYRNMTGLG